MICFSFRSHDIFLFIDLVDRYSNQTLACECLCGSIFFLKRATSPKRSTPKFSLYTSHSRHQPRLDSSLQYFVLSHSHNQRAITPQFKRTMTSSARSRPSGTSNRQRTGPIPLPTYQPPQHPLNENAIRAIQDLRRNHKLDSLKLRLNAANNHLAGAAVDINDRLVAHIALHEKSRARREKQGSQEDDGEGEKAMDEKRERTDELTGRLESGVRGIIDAKFEVEVVEKALKELETNVANNRGAIAPTQSTLGASQFRPNRRRRGGNAEDEDGEFEGNSQSAGDNGSAVDFIKRKIREQKSTYQNETMSFR